VSPEILVEETRGTRRVGEADFPLTLGGSPADIELVGASSVVAYLGLSDGELFVQPSGGPARLAVNGTPVTASLWLRAGDVLRFGATRILVGVQGDGLSLEVTRVEEENPTDPPLFVASPAGATTLPGSDPLIRPTAFEPRPFTLPRRSRLQLRPRTLLIWALLGVVALLSWFLLTARSVRLQIVPPPDRVAVRGALPGIHVGDRYLLRPGRYQLHAEKSGYRALEVALAVTEDAVQEKRFELVKLPGRLAIDVGGVAGASVLVDGAPAGTTPLPPLSLAAGDHRITIRSDRHLEHAARISIEGMGAEQTLAVTLVPSWAAVAFDSLPAGAAVRVDGREVGVTPLTAEVGAGNRAVEIVKAGYRPHRTILQVVADQAQQVPRVTLQPAEGSLSLTSEPTPAMVAVDGDTRGQTPLTLELKPGRAHQLRLSRAGYEPSSVEVSLGAGELRALHVDLVAQEGELRIEASPQDAELLVDGEPRGVANQVLRLSAEPHQIEIRREGYRPHVQSVTGRPGHPQSVRVSLEALAAAEPAVPTRVSNAQGLELRLVQPGRFQMGASRREPGRRANEALRDVELTRPFYISTTEVSNQQLRRFKPEHLSGQVEGKSLETDHHPVVRVTWDLAAAYCNWLSERESLPPAYVQRGGRLSASQPLTTGYRLPTEAEWEWVARYPNGQGPRKYPWGQSLPVAPGSGNYADVSAREQLGTALPDYDDGYPLTAPVESFPPNPLGLFNLGGNVAEWVHDIYAVRPEGSAVVERDPTGPKEGAYHVIRGSSFMDATVTELRLSYRDYGDEPRPDVGFRVARHVR
jgi:formylglycine-generating enzyme required for sulfatase activity